MPKLDPSKPKIIIAGSEGLIGKTLALELKDDFKVIKLDLALGHDLSNESLVKELMEKHSDSIGLINLFCLNPQPEEESLDLLSIPLESIRDYLNVNVVALFCVCREFARYSKRGSSSIINFSSIYGVLSPKHFIYGNLFTKHIGYAISKSAVLGMSKYLATYLAPQIRVNTIVPGGILNNQKQSFVNEYSKMSPMKRMMNVSEITSSVRYLLSEDSTYTTGSTIHVDGGWTAW